MHEYSATLEMIRIAEKYAAERGADAVKKINLVIGEESGYSGDAVRLYFDIIAAGTHCERAAIEIEEVAAKHKCASCGRLFVREPFSFVCPHCGGEARPTEIGREFYVKSVEI